MFLNILFLFSTFTLQNQNTNLESIYCGAIISSTFIEGAIEEWLI